MEKIINSNMVCEASISASYKDARLYVNGKSVNDDGIPVKLNIGDIVVYGIGTMWGTNPFKEGSIKPTVIGSFSEGYSMNFYVAVAQGSFYMN